MCTETHAGLHVMSLIFVRYQPKFELAQILVKLPGTKFNKNPFRRSLMITCGQVMTKLTGSNQNQFHGSLSAFSWRT
jgi:hypothetical protein